MSRIEIHHADGRKVIVDHDGELEPVRAAAQKVWVETVGAELPGSPGPATGFQVTERRYTAPVQSSSMRQAPRPWPVQAEHTSDSGQ